VIKPVAKDDAFLADVAASDPGAGFALWWLGQSGFLLKHQHRHLLLDPYLSDSLTRKYADTDKPHVRMTELIVDPARLNFIDVATSSHNHTDHLDGDTLGPLMQANPAMKLIIPAANRAFVADRLKCKPDWPIGIDDGTTARAFDFEFHGIPAAHEAVDRDERGQCHYLGYVVQFGGWTIYHSGDTLRYDGMAERLSDFDIDLAILPINGRWPERRVAGNLSGEEAAQLAHDIHARLVVPCHFEMFTFNTEPPDAFSAACARLGQKYRVLRCGERLSSDEVL
jgi:L-ascorbate metabolism protein UlaG (beta-lactamase superfamily)